MIRMALIVTSLTTCMAQAAPAPSDGRLPAYLLQVPESISTLLIAETDSSTLHRIVNATDGTARHDERYMSIGQNGVGKQRAWDRRTPLGVYFVVEQLDTSRLHERYGPMAFPLDYPNAWDRRNDRGGDGIWIHGVPEDGGRRPPLDTDGCIALSNEDLLALEKELVPVVTPVIIARALRWSSPAETARLRDELLAALDRWSGSIVDGDLHAYQSMYASDFEYRGMNRNEWLRYRLETIAAVPIDDLLLDDILLLADPEEDGLYLSRFRQAVTRGERRVQTIKRLYWRRNVDGNLEIVAEDNG